MNFHSIINYLKQVNPGNFFLLCSFLFGITFIIITPPFQVPDEINHFYRAYQISNGAFLSQTSNNRLGGHVPTSFIETTKSFQGLRWNMHSNTNFETIYSQFSVPLNEDNKTFVDFPNTALYSPVSYIPQAFSIFILKNLNLSPIFIFYGARLFTLLVWIACIWLAINITPIYKWLFVFLALLPMSIYSNMSLSADVVTNILSFLIISYILKLAFEDKLMDRKKFLIVIILSILLASAKVVYTPIIFLFLIIPIKKFRDVKILYVNFSLLLLIGFGTALLWSKLINGLYIPYESYNVQYRDGLDLPPCVNIQGQIEYIITHDFYIVKVFFNSLYDSFDMYYNGYIGTFGWLDTKLPIWLIHLSYISIITVAFFENNKGINFSKFQRFVLLGTLVSTIAFILLSQHLAWDCVGGEIIANIQGRYFIPVFPLLFFLFNNSKYNKQILIISIVVLTSITLLVFSVWTLFNRYYVSSEFETVKIECNAEELTSDNKFITSIPNIFLENGNRQCNRYSRSGNYSVALYSEQPYGFTYRFYSGKPGDIIKIEVWRLGNSGNIVLVGESGKAFYLTSSKVTDTDANGWDKLEYSHTLQSTMKGKEIGIYLFNNSSDTSYFDDISISINKLN